MSETSVIYARLQRHRVLIGRIVWPLLVLYVFGLQHAQIMPFDSAVGIAGLVLIALGVFVRSLSAGMLHKNTELTTGGIYAIVRNPLYFGSLLALIGVNVLIADPVMVVGSFALFAVTHVPTIRNEERGLRSTYAERWDAYAARTPRLLPRLSRLGALKGASWSFSQWRKNHEHNTVLAALVIVALLYGYSRYLAQ